MRLRRSRPRRDTEENLIALINVVFLLLIFFMVAGRLMPTDHAVIQPASSQSPDKGPVASSVVVIDRQGQLSLNGVAIDDTTLAGRLAEAPRAQDEPLQIKADADAPASRVMDLLAQLRAAGAEQIELLTLARAP